MSEFGTGFIYNLILFCEHHDRAYKMMNEMVEGCHEDPKTAWPHALGLWFNGAGDHFFDLNVPPQWKGTDIGNLATEIQSKVLNMRMEMDISVKQFESVFDDIERLARMIDEKLGSKSEVAQWG